MRKMLIGLAFTMAAAAPAWAAPDAAEQAQFESFVVAAGASNGAARSCGASEPDLAQHQATSRKNLERYAKEYGFSAAGYDGLYEKDSRIACSSLPRNWTPMASRTRACPRAWTSP